MDIGEFISDRRTFIIPVYQRNYDWKTKNCEQLFEDVKTIAESGEKHFIGTFVYQRKPAVETFQEYVIILTGNSESRALSCSPKLFMI